MSARPLDPLTLPWKLDFLSRFLKKWIFCLPMSVKPFQNSIVYSSGAAERKNQAFCRKTKWAIVAISFLVQMRFQGVTAHWGTLLLLQVEAWPRWLTVLCPTSFSCIDLQLHLPTPFATEWHQIGWCNLILWLPAQLQSLWGEQDLNWGRGLLTWPFITVK